LRPTFHGIQRHAGNRHGNAKTEEFAEWATSKKRQVGRIPTPSAGDAPEAAVHVTESYWQRPTQAAVEC